MKTNVLKKKFSSREIMPVGDIFLETRRSKNNEILMKDIDLPIDYGETCADEAMKPLNDFIQRIIHKIDNLSESVDEVEMEKE